MRRSAVLLVLCSLLFGAAASAAETLSPVGIRAVEFSDGDRRIALFVFYPAKPDSGAKPFALPFTVNLNLLDDPPPDLGAGRRPLIVLSHGRGSNGLLYAWFAEYLARRGYIVAAINHFRANTYDSNITYLAGKIWQRPKDVAKAIDFLLADPVWGPAIDSERIGIAGHSQGGFTSLWVGGAKVSADKFLAFQRGWKNNRMVPAHIRAEMPLDPSPALEVRDARVKAAFAMAPGIIKAFGMDEAGLGAMTVPAYITVGARDTQTPPGPNAEFAAKNIPDAELVVIPGLVDHEIFTNECDDEGRDEFPEACIDAPGVDRTAIHASVGAAAEKFFGEKLGVAPRPK
jgi:predicted dienelactone hydrolase